MHLAHLYLCSAITSYLWAVIAPFFMGDGFWNNQCHIKIKVTEGT